METGVAFPPLRLHRRHLATGIYGPLLPFVEVLCVLSGLNERADRHGRESGDGGGDDDAGGRRGALSTPAHPHCLRARDDQRDLEAFDALPDHYSYRYKALRRATGRQRGQGSLEEPRGIRPRPSLNPAALRRAYQRSSWDEWIFQSPISIAQRGESCAANTQSKPESEAQWTCPKGVEEPSKCRRKISTACCQSCCSPALSIKAVASYLWCDISWCKSGASSSDNKVDVQLVDPTLNSAPDLLLLVGHDVMNETSEGIAGMNLQLTSHEWT